MEAKSQLGATLKVSYNAVDVMKFIGALLVICIHTNPLILLNPELNFDLSFSLARVAVPFYFLTSSFLFFRKFRVPHGSNPEAAGRLIRYLKRIGWIYLVWAALYVPVAVLDLYKDQNLGLQSLAIYVIGYPVRFIFFGGYEHLWYLPALMVSIGLVWLLLKRFRPGFVVVLGSLFYAFAALGDSWYQWTISRYPAAEPIFHQVFTSYGTTRSGVLSGFLMVALGAFIALGSVRPGKWWGLPAATSLGLVLAESRYVMEHGYARGYDVQFALVPAALFLFLFLAGLPLKDRKIYRYLRDSSILIYCSHLAFRAALPREMDNLERFLLVTGLSVGFSVLVLILGERPRMGFLKKLY